MPRFVRLILGVALLFLAAVVANGGRTSVHPDPVTFAPIYTTHAIAPGAAIAAGIVALLGIVLIVWGIRSPKGTATAAALFAPVTPVFDHITPGRVVIVFLVIAVLGGLYEVFLHTSAKQEQSNPGASE